MNEFDQITYPPYKKREEIKDQIEFLSCKQKQTKDSQQIGFYPLEQNIKNVDDLINQVYQSLTPMQSKIIKQKRKRQKQAQKREKTSFIKFLVRLIRRSIIKDPIQFKHSIWPKQLIKPLKHKICTQDYHEIIRQNYSQKIELIFKMLSNEEIIEQNCINNKKMKKKRNKMAIMTQIKLYKLRCRHPILSHRPRQSYCKGQDLINDNQIKRLKHYLNKSNICD